MSDSGRGGYGDGVVRLACELGWARNVMEILCDCNAHIVTHTRTGM